MVVPSVDGGGSEDKESDGPEREEEAGGERSEEDEEEPLCLAVVVPAHQILHLLAESHYFRERQLSPQQHFLQPVVLFQDVTLLLLVLNQQKSTMLKSSKNFRFSSLFRRDTLKPCRHLRCCNSVYNFRIHSLDTNNRMDSRRYVVDAGCR